MPLYTQKFIRRADLRSNPSWTYVFGDNLEGVGFGGQAKEMRGELNAFGIPTKKNPAEYFNDKDLTLFTDVLERWAEDFGWLNVCALNCGATVIWPEDGIGTGLSDLPNKAPKLWTILETMREALFDQYYAGRIEDAGN